MPKQFSVHTKRCTPGWRRLLRDNRGFLVFVALMLVFRSAVADWNHVPSASMKPTIIEGDRILVNKLAYDVRVPFTLTSLVHLDDPKRGDIVVFDSEVSGKRLVKRVIGLPGDTIAMQRNQLVINGEPVRYQAVSAIDLREALPGDAHAIRLTDGAMPTSFAPVEVPPENYLVLGDNRNVSADSRAIGFVPRREIVGRSERVVLSFNPQKFYLPRSDRWWKALD